MKDACPACSKYVLTRMPAGWRCAGCNYYLADEDEACVSCGKPGQVNCEHCLEVICLECIDTHESKCEETKAEIKRYLPEKRAKQAEQMAHELAEKLTLIIQILRDQKLPVVETPELVKYNRLYDTDGKPKP